MTQYPTPDHARPTTSLVDAAFATRPGVRAELSEGVLFSYPRFPISGKRLAELLPPFRQGDPEQEVLPSLVQKVLAPMVLTPHTLHSIAESAAAYSATAASIRAGEVTLPSALLEAVARRYASLLMVEIDRALVRELLYSRVQVVRDGDSFVVRGFGRRLGGSTVILHGAIASQLADQPGAKLTEVQRREVCRQLLREIDSTLLRTRTMLSEGFEGLRLAYRRAYEAGEPQQQES